MSIEVRRIASYYIYGLFIYVRTLVIKSEERRKFIIMVLVVCKVNAHIEFQPLIIVQLELT